MKYLIVIATMVFCMTIISCKKECPITNAVCLEKVPEGELCQAYFQRWFYNESTQQCTLIGYSGCSQRGFSSKQACEACKCK